MEKVLDMNGNEFIEIEDKEVFFNGNKYSVYEVCKGTDINTIALDGKTLKLQRSEDYGEEIGYVIEALRINGNTFKIDTIWLQVEDRGWSEADIIADEKEILFVQNILKEYGIELE